MQCQPGKDLTEYRAATLAPTMIRRREELRISRLPDPLIPPLLGREQPHHAGLCRFEENSRQPPALGRARVLWSEQFSYCLQNLSMMVHYDAMKTLLVVATGKGLRFVPEIGIPNKRKDQSCVANRHQQV